jgi:hypothetical protein
MKLSRKRYDSLSWQLEQSVTFIRSLENNIIRITLIGIMLTLILEGSILYIFWKYELIPLKEKINTPFDAKGKITEKQRLQNTDLMKYLNGIFEVGRKVGMYPIASDGIAQSYLFLWFFPCCSFATDQCGLVRRFLGHLYCWECVIHRLEESYFSLPGVIDDERFFFIVLSFVSPWKEPKHSWFYSKLLPLHFCEWKAAYPSSTPKNSLTLRSVGKVPVSDKDGSAATHSEAGGREGRNRDVFSSTFGNVERRSRNRSPIRRITRLGVFKITPKTSMIHFPAILVASNPTDDVRIGTGRNSIRVITDEIE